MALENNKMNTDFKNKMDESDIQTNKKWEWGEHTDEENKEHYKQLREEREKEEIEQLKSNKKYPETATAKVVSTTSTQYTRYYPEAKHDYTNGQIRTVQYLKKRIKLRHKMEENATEGQAVVENL